MSYTYICPKLSSTPGCAGGGKSQIAANGWRYPLVGGTRQRHFDGTILKLRKLLRNAQTPTSRVHAVLGGSAFVCITHTLLPVNVIRLGTLSDGT